jgi:DNA end-binding protein Ku
VSYCPLTYQDIDPIFFAKTYYVGPDKGAEKTYSLLVKAMEDSELAGITKFVMRDKQHLGALRIRDGIITLEQLYFADEIRPVDEIKASRARVSQQELQMAQQLMESWTTDWKPEKYKDTYATSFVR